MSPLRRWPRTTRFVLIAAVVALPLVGYFSPTASATGPTVLTPANSTFMTNNGTGWYLPPPVAGAGDPANDACLTANGTVITPSSSVGNTLASCATTGGDNSGSGALELTKSAGGELGTTFYQASFPSTEGLDLQFDSFQFDSGCNNTDGTSGVGCYYPDAAQAADGIGFALAATNPADPASPANEGPSGGSLGYGPDSGSPSHKPLQAAYLGFGLDVFGNYTNNGYQGSDCTYPTILGGPHGGARYMESATVLGPGEVPAGGSPEGYCILDSTAEDVPAVVSTGDLGGSVTITGDNDTLTYGLEDASEQNPIAENSSNPVDSDPQYWTITIPAGTYCTTSCVGAETSIESELNSLFASEANNDFGDDAQLQASLGTGTVVGSSGSNLLSSPGTLDHLIVSFNAGDSENAQSGPSGLELSGDALPTLGFSAPIAFAGTPITYGPVTSSNDVLQVSFNGGSTCDLTLPNGTYTTPASVVAAVDGASVPGGCDALSAAAYEPVPSTTTADNFAEGDSGAAFLVLSDATHPSDTVAVVTNETDPPLVSSDHSDTAADMLGFELDSYGGYPNGYPNLPGNNFYNFYTNGNGVGTNEGEPELLDDPGSQTRPTNAPVKVEVLINPAASATTSMGGILPTFTVPADSWGYEIEPVIDGAFSANGSDSSDVNDPASDTTAETPVVLTGPLPSMANSCQSPCQSSWVNPATGVPYQLELGWTASTGSDDETHEVNDFSIQTVNGSVPVLTGSSANGAYVANDGTTQSVNYTITPTVSANDGTEGQPTTVSVSDQLPTGVTAGSLSGVGPDWSCAASNADSLVNCTYTVSNPSSLAAGTSLTPVTFPATIASGTTGDLVSNIEVSSDDAFSGSTTQEEQPSTSVAASASPSPATIGSTITLTASGLPSDAGGTIDFNANSAGGTTLCAVSPPFVAEGLSYGGSCTYPTTGAAAGTYPVVAVYSGDTTYAGSTADTSYQLVSMTASATPSPVDLGSSDTLSVSGLPPGAASVANGGSDAAPGTVSFTVGGVSAGANCTSVPVIASGGSAGASCSWTSANPPGPGAQTVSATYSGSGAGGSNYAPATATTSLTILYATSLNVGVSPSTATPGTQESATATVVASGGPTIGGTVNFGTSAGGSNLCSGATVSSGVATCSFTSPTGSVGAITAETVYASYSGDSNYASSSGSTQYNLYPFTLSPSPSTLAANTQTTLTASGLPSNATGTITFYGNSTGSGTPVLCTLSVVALTGSNGAQCSYTPSTVGTNQPLSATYTSNDSLASASASSTINVNGAASFSLSVLPAPVTAGTVITATASGLPNPTTGTVAFYPSASTGGSPITGCGFVPVSGSGTATCSFTTSATPGSYSVSAHYGGDHTYPPSSPDPSASYTTDGLTLVAAPTSFNVGTSTTLTASGLPSTATGHITFYGNSSGSGTPVLCSSVTVVAEGLSNGAQCTYTPTSAGSGQPLSATYTSTNLAPVYASVSGTTSITVNVISTSIQAVVSPTQATIGTSITLTASGLPTASPAPTGSIVFHAGSTTGAVLCTVNSFTTESGSLGGSCSVSTGAEGIGSYPVVAVYSGDVNYSASNSSTTSPPAYALYGLSLSPGVSTLSLGNATTLTASGLPPSATGSVTFYANGTGTGTPVICAAVTVSAGGAQCSYTPSAVGTDEPLSATYSSTNTPQLASLSANAALSVVVQVPVTGLSAAANPTATTVGATIVLTASGLPTAAPAATGSVVFSTGSTVLCTATVDSSTGTASCTAATGSLSPGSFPVTAQYSGDANYLAATATTSFSLTAGSASRSPSGGGGGLIIAPPAPPSVLAPTPPPPSIVVLIATATPSSQTFSPSDAVVLSATGLPAGATGEVVFTTGSAVDCTATVESGAARCSTSAAEPPGSYAVLASYSGDANDPAATATTAFVINPVGAENLSAAATPALAPVGGTVVLSAGGLPLQATGTITFTSGSDVLCTARVSQGSADCNAPSNLPKGTYTVLASYSGDATYAAVSATTRFEIAVAPPTAGQLNVLTPEDNPVSITAPALGGTGPYRYEIISGPPKSDGTWSMSRSGLITFYPAPGFHGPVTFHYRVRDTNGLLSAKDQGVITIDVLGQQSSGGAPTASPPVVKAVPIPAAHTGEPWSGWGYWVLIGTVGSSGALIATTSRRSRHGHGEG